MRRQALSGKRTLLAIVAAALAGSAAFIALESGDGAEAGTTRVYYIAADEVAWDYAPDGREVTTGRTFGDDAEVFVRRGADRIGSTYRKAHYREYTDGSFGQLKPVPAAWRHLGVLGPVIHAEVGDTVKVVFRNNARRPLSIHAHGVKYDKASEGAPAADGTSRREKADDAVPPGGTHTYVWEVPERAGPGEMDSSSVMWMYHSHTDEVADAYAGLIGPIVVTRRGMARADGSPKDVDRELVQLFMVFDENQSPYLERNIRDYARDPGRVDVEDEEFVESNLMHAINGYLYGNGPKLVLRKGERVRWYVMGMGTEVDLHTPHWHGDTVTINGMRSDVVSLLPGQMTVADMSPDNPGSWLFHCHVNDHITAGMSTLFRVRG